MTRITHVITGLAAHGAESMLYRLVREMDRRRFHNEVISLTDMGEIGGLLQADGVPVAALGMPRGSLNPWHLLRLARRLSAQRPHVVQTWMYHSDLAGSLAALLAGRPRVVWGIHHSNLDPHGNRRLTLLTAKACARLSGRFTDRIVCCSEAARDLHTGIGYDGSKFEVVPNGFDTAEFRPDASARREMRERLALPEHAIAIGIAARFHPQKDYANFAAAAGRLGALFPSAHFILCGDGIAWDNAELAGLIDAAGIRERCHLLGRRADMARVYPAFDIAVSSSLAEAFPLAVGEAMSCGVPSVVTDVGDSALLVGETGRAVAARDPKALAQACRELILMGAEARTALGLAARDRIERRFSLRVTVERYQEIYESMAGVAALKLPARRAERYRVAGGRDAA